MQLLSVHIIFITILCPKVRGDMSPPSPPETRSLLTRLHKAASMLSETFVLRQTCSKASWLSRTATTNVVM